MKFLIEIDGEFKLEFNNMGNSDCAEENIREKLNESWEIILNIIKSHEINQETLTSSSSGGDFDKTGDSLTKDQNPDNIKHNLLENFIFWLNRCREEQKAGFKTEISTIFTEKITDIIFEHDISSKVNNFFSFTDFHSILRDIEPFQIEIELIREIYMAISSNELDINWFKEDELIEIHKTVKRNIELKFELEKLILQISRLKRQPFADIQI